MHPPAHPQAESVGWLSIEHVERFLLHGLVRVSSSKIATTRLHGCHVAFARLVSRAPANGDVYSLYMPRHARGANSRPRAQSRTLPERLDDHVWATPSHAAALD